MQLPFLDMKTPSTLILSALLALGAVAPALADACLIPADTDKPTEYPIYNDVSTIREQWQTNRLLYHLVYEYQLHVRQIAAWERGLEDSTGTRREELLEGLTTFRARAKEYRALILERLQSHPEEVNDALLDHGSTGSVLYKAILSNDVELVRLLLEAGAIPFLHEHPGWAGKASGEVLLRWAGEEGCEATKPEIVTMLQKARSQYNVLEIMIQAQQRGVDLKASSPQRPRKEN